MRKSLLMLLCAAMVFGVSCKKNDPEPTSSAPVSAKVDGTAWNSTGASATYDQEVLSVAASASNGSSLSFSVEDVTGTGNYAISSRTGAAMYAISQTDMYSTLAGGSGTVIITEFTSNSAKGTFTFTAKNNSGAEKAVTDGKFSLTY